MSVIKTKKQKEALDLCHGKISEMHKLIHQTSERENISKEDKRSEIKSYENQLRDWANRANEIECSLEVVD